jgi:uncharacterized membrane protein YbhN (UPF0104 family)
MKKTIVGIAISTILLIWVFGGVEWSLTFTSLPRVRWPYIFPYMFVLLIAQSLRPFRWELLLRLLQRVGQKVFFPITSVGLLAIMILFFAFSFPLSLIAAFVLVIIVDLGLMIPSAPGFVGSFQFLFIIGLAIFGVGREQALSFSILSHALQLLFVAAPGLIFLPMMKIPGFTLGKRWLPRN